MTTRKPQPIVVKRYARTRLYDATNRRYISVEQLRGWVAQGIPFVVMDTETGVDVTRIVLA